jgi:hypothetical protein
MMCKDVRCPGTRGMPCISRKYDGLLEKATIQELNVEQLAQLQWASEHMLEFDYCTDSTGILNHTLNAAGMLASILVQSFKNIIAIPTKILVIHPHCRHFMHRFLCILAPFQSLLEESV